VDTAPVKNKKKRGKEGRKVGKGGESTHLLPEEKIHTSMQGRTKRASKERGWGKGWGGETTGKVGKRERGPYNVTSPWRQAHDKKHEETGRK